MANIRRAEVSDVEGVQEVFYQTWLTTYPNDEAGITKEDIEDRWKDRLNEKRLELRREELRNPNSEPIFIAEENKKIVGVCRVSKGQVFNKLEAMYVLPLHQGKGIGNALWEAALQYLGTQKDISVSLATYNDTAKAFYEKHGFVDTGKRFTEERLRMKSGSTIPQMEMLRPAQDC